MVIILQWRLEEYLVAKIAESPDTTVASFPSVRTGRRQTVTETQVYSLRRFSV